ncbi:MAG: hypothetical protein EBQ96_09640 [Proteobacteria bacterium]|nr:hypothetical protein [Pseudomonadota bacterium]
MAFKPRPYSIPFRPQSVAIQGQRGSFSHTAAASVFNEITDLQCFDTFDDPFNAVQSERADVAVIPVANSIAGPVPYVPGLIAAKQLHIVGEYFLPIEMCVMGLPHVRIQDIEELHSHTHALAQCRKYFARHDFKAVVNPDTAGAAKMVAERGDPRIGSISPARAAHEYGLEIKRRGIQDDPNNVTRFLVLTHQKPDMPVRENGRHYMTAIILNPKQKAPWALADILGILRDSGVYHSAPWTYTGANFRQKGILLELFGHPDDKPIKAALDAMRIKKSGQGITYDQRIVGVFPAHHTRRFGRGPA